MIKRRQDEPPYIPTPEEIREACERIKDEWYDQRLPKVYSEQAYGKRYRIDHQISEQDFEAD